MYKAPPPGTVAMLVLIAICSHTGHLGLCTEPEHDRHLRKQTAKHSDVRSSVSRTPVSADMVNNKTAVVADLQAALDSPPSLNTAGVSIRKQLGISMSDHVN